MDQTVVYSFGVLGFCYTDPDTQCNIFCVYAEKGIPFLYIMDKGLGVMVVFRWSDAFYFVYLMSIVNLKFLVYF